MAAELPLRFSRQQGLQKTGQGKNRECVVLVLPLPIGQGTDASFGKLEQVRVFVKQDSQQLAGRFLLLPFADRDLDPAELALEQIVRPVAAGAADAGDAGNEIIPPVDELEGQVLDLILGIGVQQIADRLLVERENRRGGEQHADVAVAKRFVGHNRSSPVKSLRCRMVIRVREICHGMTDDNPAVRHNKSH